ncbi:putative disease resistance RPP13-like protein 1 [Ziziphus jujuba]|uniref:Disease resistance RPP13-like protein 1 n=1 Tax=Ziziphus jujuba TaxID=326968 RepID=A0ABM3ZYE5_ZIZJJ|nr:putative disease resistance RPP13-like protein 1 [Ziziphus jujuba]
MHTAPIYYLEHLRDEDCWQLFAKHAFDNEDLNAYPDLVTIGRRVSEKCKGLPLAVKTLGGILCYRLDVAKWKRISVNEIRNFSDNESYILPALRLSYHCLPSHLKRCFAFCSIFPKDYTFQRQQMVLSWMKENLLQRARRNKRMEDIGDECFNEEYCFTFEEANSKEDMMKVRHLCFNVYYLEELRYFRALSLLCCENLKHMSELIGELKCSYLIEFSKNMHHLINLRHFDISESDKDMEMLSQINKLTNLQTLSTSIVGKDNGTKILELRELSDFHGELSLENLQKVASVKDASETELVDKNCLEALCLSWKGHTNDSKHDREILKELLPCTNLKILSIYAYGGRTCPNCYPPSKLSIFTDLCGVLSEGAEFYGFSASNSMRKPFASLEFLSFSEMLAWEEWSSIEAEDGEVFPRLQQTEIYNCGRLNTADLPHTLPCSAKLIIDGSEVLVSSLPRTSAIQDLELDKCEEPQLQQPNQQ